MSDPEFEHDATPADLAKAEEQLHALWSGMSDEERTEALADARLEADTRELDWNDAREIARLSVLLVYSAYARGDLDTHTPDLISMTTAAAALAHAEAVLG